MITVKAKKGGKGEWQEETDGGGKEGIKGREEGGKGEEEGGKGGWWGSDESLPSGWLTWTSEGLVRRAPWWGVWVVPRVDELEAT